MHTWWELREKYKKEMKEFTGEENEDDPPKPEPKTGLEDLMDNPNVTIKDSYVNGKKIDNSADREL